MHLSLDKDAGILRIKLSWLERLLAVKPGSTLDIPLKSITSVSTERPPTEWPSLRLPGTSVPGLIKAGSYYTRKGWEFWYAVRGKGYLAIELENERFRRIALTLDDNERWAEELRAAAE